MDLTDKLHLQQGVTLERNGVWQGTSIQSGSSCSIAEGIDLTMCACQGSSLGTHIGEQKNQLYEVEEEGTK